MALIAAYKDIYAVSIEGGLRSGQIYVKISDKLKEGDCIFTAQQCKWKFASLKQKYLKYKDAQKASNSGGEPVYFKYSVEMDDIFGSSHSAGLPIPASSSRYVPAPLPDALLNDDEDEEETIVSPPPKRRRVTISEAIAQFRQDSTARHKEKMEVIKTNNELMERQLALQERAIDEHKSLMQKLIDKL